MFDIGVPAPMFVGKTTTNEHYQFHSVGGRYIVLSFLGDLRVDILAKTYQDILKKGHQYFDDENVAFFAISTQQETESLLQERIPGIRFFKDYDKKISVLYRALDTEDDTQYRPYSVILNPNLTIRHVLFFKKEEDHASRLIDLIKQLPIKEEFAGVKMHAPILIIPNVFPINFCNEMIDYYHKIGGVPSGYMIKRDGYSVYNHDSSFKRRSDCTIDDESIKERMRHYLSTKVRPQVKKAYHFDLEYIERYIVACYTAEEKGYFKAHRDNTTPATLHRNFACTINLNDDFEGGELLFPEYGTNLYKPPLGAALIFSCSILHEAQPVTKGIRYCTLPFFYNEAGKNIREENIHLLKIT